MKKQSHENWIGEFIYGEKLSDEAVYAVYQFLDQLVLQFEMKAFCQIINHGKKLEKSRREFEDNDPPF